ncbi:MAG: Wzz/FepE/Etk N-terminal domain-containing protein [Oscillospiraceae bacterium]|jgi:capsular polysaccharide biosynthesis protein|nr:Wzz/FepE/Etk N-terminal domain-containing protein [Oscillospiraceae bacterium]
MKNEASEDMEIDLSRVLFALKRHIIWLLIGLLVGAVSVYAVSAYLVPKKYTSSVSLYVNNTKNTTSQQYSVQEADINASQKLVDTYIVILNDDQIMQEVADKLSQRLSVKELKQLIKMETVNNTEVLKISAETGNADFSAEICNTVAKVAPDVLKRVVKAGSVEVIGKATPAVNPSSPNVIRNTAIGAVIGLLIMIIAAIAAELLDRTVKGEADVKEHLDVPVLGEIPHIKKEDGK